MEKDVKNQLQERDRMDQSEEVDTECSGNDIGETGMPLCREPWENLYILRRGILPCCYGNPVGYSFPDYAEAWNSPEIQEIRRYLSQGKLSPYCMECLGCPIVQRYLAEHPLENPAMKQWPFLSRFINRLLFRIPSKIHQSLSKK
ncbi:MAG: hypothetical protein GQ545_10075 [Candidatus Aminicenantes bacterium]|nr:hypothetical protein [Candidatus Aminicenantes bacterium]